MTAGSGPAAGTASSEAGRRPVDCSEALSKLFEFLDSEIAEADCDRIREHLADCEPCLGEYDIEDHLKRLVRRSCHDSAPVELHVRIRERLVVMQGRAGVPETDRPA